MNKNKMVVGVTGANGFIGRKIASKLHNEGFKVISLQRTGSSSDIYETRIFDLCLLETINKELLHGIDIVIHTAALVHKLQAENKSFKTMNVEATKKLYELSIAVNVKKFFLLSSVAVYGKTSYTSSIGLDFPVAPKSAYGISKLDAENYLLNMVGDEAPKISILRLPLVIGKNAPGNLRLLEKLASLKLPLPFGCADNKRTVVSVEAVVDTLIDGCFNINSYQGLNLLGNDKPISTKQLIISLRKEVGLKPKLIPIPRLFMKFFLLVIGKKKIYEQLFEDLIFINSIENKNKNKNKNLNSNKN